MALINISTTNLTAGVSQQAEDLRKANSAEEQINAISRISTGLSSRPPSEYVAKLDTAVDKLNSFVHFIDRENTQYAAIAQSDGTLANTTLSLYRLSDGAPCSLYTDEAGTVPVSLADLSYFVSSTPASSLRAVTVNDYTFVANSSITPALTADVSLNRNPEAILFVKNVSAGDTFEYTIRCGGNNYVSGTVTASSGNTQGVIAAALVTNKPSGLPAGFTGKITSDGECVYITNETPAAFSVTIKTSTPDTLYCFKENTQALTDLPVHGYVGFKLKIQGDPSDADSAYYVQFTGNDETVTADNAWRPGYWKECVANAVPYKLNAATMPHQIVPIAGQPLKFQLRQAYTGTYGTSTFKTWGERGAGDTDSNPNPAFVGKPINGVFFHENRLGFLAGENVVLSEAGEYLNFWRTTVLQVLDSDPIDVEVNHNLVSTLYHAIPNSEQLLLISPHSQFSLRGGDLLSPKTVSTRLISDYDVDVSAAPLSIGNSVFLPYNNTICSGLNEYSIDSTTNLFKAQNLSEHVSHYLDGRIVRMTEVEAERMVLLFTTGYSTGCYLYSWYDYNGTKIQVSFSKIDFGTNSSPVAAFAKSSEVYVIINRVDGTFIERMDLSAGYVDPYSDFAAGVDRRITEAECSGVAYSAITGQTTMTLPYSIDGTVDTPRIVTRYTSDADVDGGYEINGVSASGTTLTINGDYTTKHLWIGIDYAMEYTASKPYLRTETRTGSTVIRNGRLQVRYANVGYSNTMYFTTELIPVAKNESYATYASRSLGTYNSVVAGKLALSTGKFRVPVFGQNNTFFLKIVNNSPFPCNITAIDWECMFTAKTRSV